MDYDLFAKYGVRSEGLLIKQLYPKEFVILVKHLCRVKGGIIIKKYPYRK